MGVQILWDKVSVCTQIFAFLHEHLGQPVREHDLIRHLDNRDCFAAFQHEPTNLQLYRKHFITRHCLYSLQDNLSRQWRLRFNTFDICLDDAQASTSAQVDFPSADLRDYYLDMTNLAQADTASIEELLQSFWTKYAAADASSQALAILGVDVTASWEEVQSAYRRKAQRAHPDRGGSAADFAEVQGAYRELRKHFNTR
jgi:DnaJ-domain-containing protein 1